MHQIVVIAHNIRSCHNIGSLLRTSEGLGVTKVYLTGYTPYPLRSPDSRLPYVAEKNHKAIAKTALGAENSSIWEHQTEVVQLLMQLVAEGYQVCALEQTPTSIPLPSYKPNDKLVLLIGSEVEGVSEELLKLCPVHLEIPMFGKKESFNVVEASTMALYHCTFNR